MIGGNALGDGSKPKDSNSTEEKGFETFQEKYRRELKKDLDDLGFDDDEQIEGMGEGENEEGEGDSTEAGEEAV